MTGSTGAADRDKDWAIIWRNLKGPRDKDVLATAEALERRSQDPREPRTREAFAKKANVSKEMVRQFRSLLKLPSGVRELFRSGALRGVEKGHKLHQLQLHRSDEVVVAAAHAMTGLDAHRSRALVDYLLKHPRADVATAVEVVELDRTKIEKVFNVVAELDEAAYRTLASAARARRTTTVDLVGQIVRTWLEDDRR